LAGTGNCGTTSLDFNSFQKSLNNEEACYVAFRYKDSFADAPWAFIMYTPDTISVKDRMLYSSSFGAARDALGFKFFSKIKRYAVPTDFKWIQFQNSESEKLEDSKGGGGASKSSSAPSAANRDTAAHRDNTPAHREHTPAEEKPWSQRELMLQQLERDEEIARREYEQKAVAVIALAQLAFPLTEPVTEAVNQLQDGQHNWIQLRLNTPPTHFELVISKNLGDYELEDSVDPKNPQFYLYNTNNTLVVIYSCPEPVKGEQGFAQARQSRMIYATAKSSLYEALTNMNLSLSIKKYDIVEPKELAGSALNSHIQSRAADIKNAKQLQGSRSYDSPGVNRSVGRLGGSPVYGSQPASLASVMVNNNSLKKPLPRGVVLPPKGAHC
jgi:hypothetical protein